jgi:hypothetical protein
MSNRISGRDGFRMGSGPFYSETGKGKKSRRARAESFPQTATVHSIQCPLEPVTFHVPSAFVSNWVEP